jgi:ABC-type branched-subunit amino acid transport system substrate-binding protein
VLDACVALASKAEKQGKCWDRNDKSREFSPRFMKRTGRMPNMIQAGTYSATLQYLKAVKAEAGRDWCAPLPILRRE